MKRIMKPITFLSIIFLIPIAGITETKPKSFLDGVKAYQAKNYEESKQIFTSLSKEHPDNPQLLFNLGLSEFQLQNPGLALGLWRKAISLDKSFTPTQRAINYVESLLFPDKQNSSFTNNLYNKAENLSLHFWFFLSLTSAFIFFWYILEYRVKFKKSPLSWPIWIYTLPVPMILSTSLLFLIYKDQCRIKATVIEKNRFTYANPSLDAPSLYKLKEGQLVFVEKFHGKWTQIRTLSGSPSWIPSSSLIPFGKSQGI